MSDTRSKVRGLIRDWYETTDEDYTRIDATDREYLERELVKLVDEERAAAVVAATLTPFEFMCKLTYSHGIIHIFGLLGDALGARHKHYEPTYSVFSAWRDALVEAMPGIYKRYEELYEEKAK